MDRCIIEQKCTFWYWICNAWDKNKKKKHTHRWHCVSSTALQCWANAISRKIEHCTIILQANWIFYEMPHYCYSLLTNRLEIHVRVSEWERERSIKFDIWDKNSRTRLGISIDCYCCCCWCYCKFNWSNHHICIKKTNEKTRDTKKKTQNEVGNSV